MFFTFAKALQMLILPPGGLLLLFLAGAIIGRRHRRAGRVLGVIAIMLLYLLSLPVTANLLIRPLEAFSRPLDKVPLPADAVVVLGSGVLDLSWVPAPSAPSEMAIARLVEGVTLAKRHGLPLVIAGGSGSLTDVKVREAGSMARIAEELGMDHGDLLLDNRSRNTRENAVEVRKLVAGDRIVLVTSAFHMKRSAALFAKQGFTVTPAPADFHSESRPSSAYDLLPRMPALGTSTLALAEYLSLAWQAIIGAI